MPLVIKKRKISSYMILMSYIGSTFTLINTAHTQNMTLNDQIKSVDRQYQAQILSAQGALAQANMNYTRCGMEANKGADGKANPDLEEAPDKTMSILQGVLPGVMQAAPALPEVLGNLFGADSEADTRRKSAIRNYNDELEGFKSAYGANATLRAVSEDEKNSENVMSSSRVRTAAMQNCVSEDVNKNNQCVAAAQSLAQGATELVNRMDLAKSTNTATQQLGAAALSAAAGGFMGHMSAEEQEKQIKRQNEITTRVANNNLQLCETSATAEINNAKRNLAQLEMDRADTLRDLALRNALANNEPPPLDDMPNDIVDKLPPINPGTPDPAKAKDPTALAQNEGGGGGGGAAGGAPGAGGGGGGGSPEWNFGGPQGNFLGGGLPAQDAGAQFMAGGGGGAFGGGFGQDGGAMGLSLNPGAAGNAGGPNAERGLASIGDGGLNVMMARMRIRFAYHAGELMQGVTLKSLAQKEQAPAAAPTTGVSAN
jgi:hypothetical protein